MARLSPDVPNVFVQTVVPSLLTLFTTIYHTIHAVILMLSEDISMPHLSCCSLAGRPTNSNPATSIGKPQTLVDMSRFLTLVTSQPILGVSPTTCSIEMK